MKKFMIAALFMLSMTATNSFACGPEITHNYYLFDVTAGDFKKNRNIVERCDEFWKNYTNGTVSSYQWHQDEIMEFAQKKERRGDGGLFSRAEQIPRHQSRPG